MFMPAVVNSRVAEIFSHGRGVDFECDPVTCFHEDVLLFSVLVGNRVVCMPAVVNYQNLVAGTKRPAGPQIQKVAADNAACARPVYPDITLKETETYVFNSFIKNSSNS